MIDQKAGIKQVLSHSREREEILDAKEMSSARLPPPPPADDGFEKDTGDPEDILDLPSLLLPEAWAMKNAFGMQYKRDLFDGKWCGGACFTAVAFLLTCLLADRGLLCALARLQAG